ncbi:hypothetical protein ACIBL5_03655 [Streptomyces sp. NPDC050516]|uniref:hypothetical protein n=1 Tax=Streptomyces sp. NPDC050516 TaxID=3365621 RepID=UPI00378FC274
MEPHVWWPLHGLRTHTPRLELRLPDTELLSELAQVAAGGAHAPDRMPFTFPWTDGSPAGLGAHAADSAAMTDNPRPLGVSRRLGYRDNGLTTAAVRDRPVTLRRLRLERAERERRRTVDVRVVGLDACRAEFGV